MNWTAFDKKYPLCSFIAKIIADNDLIERDPLLVIEDLFGCFNIEMPTTWINCLKTLEKDLLEGNVSSVRFEPYSKDQTEIAKHQLQKAENRILEITEEIQQLRSNPGGFDRLGDLIQSRKEKRFIRARMLFRLHITENPNQWQRMIEDLQQSEK